MKLGDIVLVNDNCYLKEFFTGPCEIIEIKVTTRLTRYLIRTTYPINGKPNLTNLTETEIKTITEIRNNKLKELGI